MLANQESIADNEFVALRNEILAVVALETRQMIWLIDMAVHRHFVGLHWQFTADTFCDKGTFVIATATQQSVFDEKTRFIQLIFTIITFDATLVPITITDHE